MLLLDRPFSFKCITYERITAGFTQSRFSISYFIPTYSKNCRISLLYEDTVCMEYLLSVCMYLINLSIIHYSLCVKDTQQFLKKQCFYKKKLCLSFPRQSSFLKSFLQKRKRLISCFLLLDEAAERR